MSQDFDPSIHSSSAFRAVFGTDDKGSYHLNRDKLMKVTEDGLRISVYPDGRVRSQFPGQSHRDYRDNLRR